MRLRRNCVSTPDWRSCIFVCIFCARIDVDNNLIGEVGTRAVLDALDHNYGLTNVFLSRVYGVTKARPRVTWF